MKYDDLEKTRDLFDIEEVPSPIENIEMEGASKDNLTDEFTLGLKEETQTDEIKPKKNNSKWKNLSKKSKIFIILSILFFVILIICLVLFFILKEDEKPSKSENPKVPEVIVEKDNYIFKNGVLSFLDENDNELGTYTCKNNDENLCFIVNYNNSLDNFDTTMYIYEDETEIERRSKIYLNNYVFIYDNNELNKEIITLYNIKEQKNEGVYTLVKGFNNSDYVILKNNNDKYGAIEFTDEGIIEKIEFKFDYLGQLYDDSKIVAKTNNKYFIYTTDGNLDSKGLSYEIKSYNNEYISVYNEEYYYLYDYKANLIYEDYDYIKLYDKYVALVKDKELYIKDYNNNKYHEESIKLNNTYYNEMNIYNKNKVLLESKKSFDINIEDNIDVIFYTKTGKEKNKTIFINDGKISSLYKNLNYFDDVFYFYSDEDETELIGKYECKNKNNINGNSTTFNNCKVLSVESDETKGWMPIFNKKYIFMVDSIDVNNPVIMLYDLNKNDTLSEYRSIDVGYIPSEEKITFEDVQENYIIAKNKNNKYGVIKMSSNVEGVIPFKYNSLEKLKDYYMALESTGTYLLIDKNGLEVSSKYGYKIIDYKNNYLKVIDNDNKYYIYDFKGNKIEETAYLHISLYNDYYVVIDINKKLDIHKYDDISFKLSTLIDINSDDYENAFEVGRSDKGYTIKIKSTGEVFNASLEGVLEGDEEEIIPEDNQNNEVDETVNTEEQVN
ncbi:MAG: hypothetical protein E7163_05840 [Firmicutes bacterium]|nr:hypothetical protein [Bacillota bacterium]